MRSATLSSATHVGPCVISPAVNRVTAEALKEKAAKLGQIKQISEDAQTGSLTIVLEV